MKSEFYVFKLFPIFEKQVFLFLLLLLLPLLLIFSLYLSLSLSPSIINFLLFEN